MKTLWVVAPTNLKWFVSKMRPSSNNEKEIRRVIKKKLFLFLNAFVKKKNYDHDKRGFALEVHAQS